MNRQLQWSKPVIHATDPMVGEIKALKPSGDFVLVEVMERDRTTPNGLHLPENYDDRTRIGRVIAFGPGKHTESGTRNVIDTIKEGDLILYADHTWAKIEVGGVKCVLMQESGIMGVIEV